MKRIVVVPGHSFLDPGAVNASLDLKEYDCVLEIAMELFKSDEWKDIDIVLKGRNRYASLAEEINSLNPDYVIELHLNAANGRVQGTEVLYCRSSSRGKEMAGIIQSELIKSLKYSDRGIKGISSDERGASILWKTKAPCIIIESCFIDSIKSKEDLKISDTVSAIKKGIKEIVNTL
ncbi:N-acetylmuramoyl-L-alanine amidase [uncultured Ilyobacter sp.]|uniref:N-acetylmuramoyl-L-alanine amidase n=1 Tax=uncultured Ilyobacter sp. TaxID=544433 RepID=UPI0029C08664|nr:N-acetylmuramoyl-L-alanine amidase [uncultured Ilyobacter sp.]